MEGNRGAKQNANQAPEVTVLIVQGRRAVTTKPVCVQTQIPASAFFLLGNPRDTPSVEHLPEF